MSSRQAIKQHQEKFGVTWEQQNNLSYCTDKQVLRPATNLQ